MRNDMNFLINLNQVVFFERKFTLRGGKKYFVLYIPVPGLLFRYDKVKIKNNKIVGKIEKFLDKKQKEIEVINYG